MLPQQVISYLESIAFIKLVKFNMINRVNQSIDNCVIHMKDYENDQQKLYPGGSQAICHDVANYFKAQGIPLTSKFINNSNATCIIKLSDTVKC
jgi:hypothetical protein